VNTATVKVPTGVEPYDTSPEFILCLLKIIVDMVIIKWQWVSVTLRCHVITLWLLIVTHQLQKWQRGRAHVARFFPATILDSHVTKIDLSDIGRDDV
jgi:hypothetical protein